MDIQVFNNGKFGNVRIVMENEKPLFCGKDIASALGYKDTNNALKQHCRGVAIYHPTEDCLGRKQDARFISEGDLYRLIANSKLPSAQEFESWVFDEVLPSIRKTGAYLSPVIDSAMLFQMAEAMAKKEQQIKLLEQQKAVMAPKADFYDTVVQSPDAVDMAVAAKTLNMGIGRNTMFKILRDKGILQNNNIPYQAYVDRGYFRCIESKYTAPDGTQRISIKTVVLQKGLDYIRKILLSNKENLSAVPV